MNQKVGRLAGKIAKSHRGHNVGKLYPIRFLGGRQSLEYYFADYQLAALEDEWRKICATVIQS